MVDVVGLVVVVVVLVVVLVVDVDRPIVRRLVVGPPLVDCCGGCGCADPFVEPHG